MRHKPFPEQGTVNLLGLRLEVWCGNVAVESADDAPHGWDQLLRSSSCAKLKICCAPLERNVCRWLDSPFQVVIFSVTDDANDFFPRIVLGSRSTQVQPERIPAFQISADKLAIYNCHFVSGLEIGLCERASREQRDAHRIKEPWAYRKDIPHDPFFLAFEAGVATREAAGQQNAG